MVFFSVSGAFARRQVKNHDNLLEGFKLLLQTIDKACPDPIHDAEAIAEAKTLVHGYIPILKKANSRLTDRVSWDEIMDAVNESAFFQHYPGLLFEINPDLKYKPGADCPALNDFANNFISEAEAPQAVEELNKMGIDNENITTERIIALSSSLLDSDRCFDGWQTPYRLLLPFITLACSKLKSITYEDRDEDTYRDLVVHQALADAASMVSVTDLQEMRNK